MSTDDLDPTCRELGIVADLVEPGHAILRMTVTESMTNPHGMAHGGYVFLLADAAFSYAVNSPEAVTVATSAQVTFLRPAHPGDVLVAEAVERVKFGRNGICDVTVRTPGGSVVAEFRGQSLTSATRPRPT